MVGTPGSGEGGDRSGLAQPRGACVAGGRAGHQVGPLGNASHTMAYRGVGLVPSYTGLVPRGGQTPRKRRGNVAIPPPFGPPRRSG